ncbi:MAG: SOS response-associated peptidase [Pseudomonadota bacterium]
MCGRFASALIAGDADTADWLRIERDAAAPDWVEQGPAPDHIDRAGGGASAEAAPLRVAGEHSGAGQVLAAMPAGAWPAPSWNIAPTQSIAIILPQGRAEGEAGAGPRRVARARWGLVPTWWRKPMALFKATTFNARSEEAAGKPMFRDAWRGSARAVTGASGRCLIPAAGYFEWTGKAGAKTPWFITRRTNRPGLCFAGVWSRAVLDETEMLTATILTTAAGPSTRHLHPRSPVVLDEADFDGWLAGPSPEDQRMMAPIPDVLTQLYEVDTAVGQVRNDTPDLVEPVGLGL